MPRLRLPRSGLAALAAVLAAAALAGCAGTVGEDRPEVDATLLLDGPPSAVDAGIATAVVRNFDGAEGVHLTLRRPGAPDAGVRALRSGRAAFAVLAAETLAAHPDLVGIMALTTRAGGAEPELVVATSRRRLDDAPGVARSTVRALLRGYEMTLADPESSISDLQALFPRLDRSRLIAELDRRGGALFPPGRQMGALPAGPRYADDIVPAAAAANREP